MVEETFAEGTSFIHRLDPRIKIVAALAFSVLTAVADRFPALCLALAAAAGLVFAARLSGRAVAYRLAIVNGFVLLLWVMLPFTYPGTHIFSVGPFDASREGTLYALLITLKSNAIVLACIALLSTTYLVALGRALGRLRVPDKLVHILLFMLRYLSLMARDYQRLTTSMKVRCFRPRTSMHTYRYYAHMVGMLLVSSYETAEAVHAAMLCRGFKGKFYTTDDFAIRSIDVLFGILMTGTLMLMAVLQWTRILP
jgi:cobalt/nickel transport system permease protein